MMIAEKFASNQGTMGDIGGAVGGFMMGGAMGGSIVDIARNALDPEKSRPGSLPRMLVVLAPMLDRDRPPLM